jgi:hypothetical protein
MACRVFNTSRTFSLAHLNQRVTTVSALLRNFGVVRQALIVSLALAVNTVAHGTVLMVAWDMSREAGSGETNATSSSAAGLTGNAMTSSAGLDAVGGMQKGRYKSQSFDPGRSAGLGQVADVPRSNPINLDFDVDEPFEFAFTDDSGADDDLEDVIIATCPAPSGEDNIDLFNSMDPFTNTSHTFGQSDGDFVNSVLDLTPDPLSLLEPSSVRVHEIDDLQRDQGEDTERIDSFRFAENLNHSENGMDTHENSMDAQLNGAIAPEVSTLAIWMILVGSVVACRKRLRALISR